MKWSLAQCIVGGTCTAEIRVRFPEATSFTGSPSKPILLPKTDRGNDAKHTIKLPQPYACAIVVDARRNFRRSMAKKEKEVSHLGSSLEQADAAERLLHQPQTAAGLLDKALLDEEKVTEPWKSQAISGM